MLHCMVKISFASVFLLARIERNEIVSVDLLAFPFVLLLDGEWDRP